MLIGLDIGGTKIEAAAVDDGGATRARQRIPLPPTYPAVLDRIAELVAGLERDAGRARGVGIGTPGALSPATGCLHNAENTPLDGKPFLHDIARHLDREVRVGNDAQCFALSEATDGAAAGAAVAVGVILGTGVGAGIVVHGKLVRGAHASAGEWGHNPLPWATAADHPTPHCYCGRRGCLESYLSGPALAADHRRITGEQLAAPAIATRAAAGDAACAATLARYTDRLGRALTTLIAIVDPDVIVLGGGLSNVAALYTDVAIDTPLVPARHGDASGVRGAAFLARA